MISVVVRVEHGAEALAVTLTALVPAVADGLVGDAVVLAPRPDDDIAAVADALGAKLLASPDATWASAARLSRRDWILCLNDGDVPGDGWIRALDRFIALSPPERAFGRLARPRASWRERLAGLFAGRQVRAGDLVRRELLLGSARGKGRPVRVSAALGRDPVLK